MMTDNILKSICNPLWILGSSMFLFVHFGYADVINTNQQIISKVKSPQESLYDDELLVLFTPPIVPQATQGTFSKLLPYLNQFSSSENLKPKSKTQVEVEQIYQQTIQQIKTLIKQEPQNAFLWSKLFELQINYQQHVEFMKFCYEILATNNSNIQALTYAGQTSFLMKRYYQAEVFFQQALKYDTKNAHVWNNLGVLYNFTKQYSKAVDALEASTRYNQQYFQAFVNLAHTYSNTSQYEKSTKSFEKALILNPRHADTWYDLGNHYFYINNYDQAIRCFSRAININPNDALYWNNLGYTYNKKRQFKLALNALNKAITLDNHNSQIYSSIGEIYFDMAQYDKAEKYILQSLKIQRKNPDAWRLLAKIYEATNRPEQAKQSFNHSLSM